MRGKAQGYILLEVMVVVAFLVALMGMLLANQRASIQERQDNMRQQRAEMMARSGIAYAFSTLNNTNTNTSLVTQTDDWYTLGQSGQEEFQIGQDTFRIQIVDGGALMNINSATEAQLQQLPLTQEQTDSLLDWREGGQTPRAEGGKDSYYNSLEQPYNAKLGSLSTLNELLLIKGWTAKILYTTQADMTSTQIQPEDALGNPLPLIGMLTVDSGAPNTRADDSARVNFSQQGLNQNTLAQIGLNNQAVVAQLVARAPYTSFRALLGVPGIDATTAQTLLDGAGFGAATRLTGKININTASEQVLRSVPNLTPDVATAIVGRQASGFRSLGELSTVPGLSITALAQVADSFTVGCDTWILRVYGESGGVGTAVEAVVSKVNNKMQILKWNRLNVSGIPAWWGWQQEILTTTQLGATQ